MNTFPATHTPHLATLPAFCLRTDGRRRYVPSFCGWCADGALPAAATYHFTTYCRALATATTTPHYLPLPTLPFYTYLHRTPHNVRYPPLARVPATYCGRCVSMPVHHHLSRVPLVYTCAPHRLPVARLPATPYRAFAILPPTGGFNCLLGSFPTRRRPPPPLYARERTTRSTAFALPPAAAAHRHYLLL